LSWQRREFTRLYSLDTLADTPKSCSLVGSPTLLTEPLRRHVPEDYATLLVPGATPRCSMPAAKMA